MTALSIDVEMSGPLFERGRKILGRRMGLVVQSVMERGEQLLDETLRPRPKGVYLSVQQAGKGKASTGHYRRNVHASRRDLHAKITDGGVVYGPWLEKGRGRFKGYASFRKVSQKLDRTEGARILKKHLGKLVMELS